MIHHISQKDIKEFYLLKKTLRPEQTEYARFSFVIFYFVSLKGIV